MLFLEDTYMIKYLSYIMFIALLNGSLLCASMMVENPCSVQGKPCLACYVGDIKDLQEQPELYNKINTICHEICTKLRSPNVFHGPMIYHFSDGHIKVLFNQYILLYSPNRNIFTFLNGKEITSKDMLKIMSHKQHPPIHFTHNGIHIPEHNVLYAGAAYLRYSMLHRLFKLNIIPQRSLTAINFNTQFPDYSTVTLDNNTSMHYELSSRMFGFFDEKSKGFKAMDKKHLHELMKYHPA